MGRGRGDKGWVGGTSVGDRVFRVALCVYSGGVCSEWRGVFRMALCVQNAEGCPEWRCVFRVCVQSGAVCSEYVFRVALCVQSVCSEWRCVFRVALCVQSVCSECVFRASQCVQSVCSEWRCVFRVEHWDVQNELLHGHWYEETLKDPHVSENMFKMARPLDPYPKLYLNDFTAVNSGASTEVRVLSGFWLVPATPHPPSRQSTRVPALISVSCQTLDGTQAGTTPPHPTPLLNNFTAAKTGASTEISVFVDFSTHPPLHPNPPTPHRPATISTSTISRRSTLMSVCCQAFG